MKTLARPTIASCALLLAFAVAAPGAAHAQNPPAVNLTVTSEAEALAAGFSDAYNVMANLPVYLTYAREDKCFTTLTGVRDVRAAGAVLIISTDHGLTLALPARSVVLLTDERPSVPGALRRSRLLVC